MNASHHGFIMAGSLLVLAVAGCEKASRPRLSDLEQYLGMLPEGAQLLSGRRTSSPNATMWIVQSDARIPLPIDRTSHLPLPPTSGPLASPISHVSVAPFPATALDNWLAQSGLASHNLPRRHSTEGSLIEWQMADQTVRIRECQYGESWISVVEVFIRPN